MTPDIAINVTGCSMGCLYSDRQPVSACRCKCGGAMHGLMTGQQSGPARCTPSAEARCKSGEEGGVCTCACGGRNHGVHITMQGYKIVDYT